MNRLSALPYRAIFIIISFLIMTLFTVVRDSDAQTLGTLPKAQVIHELNVVSASDKLEIIKKLDADERLMAYHLNRVGKFGKEILLFQNHRFGLEIHDLLVESLSEKNMDFVKSVFGPEGFNEYVRYAAMFEELSGPYLGSHVKFVLSKVSAFQIQMILALFNRELDFDKFDAISKLMTDPGYEVLSKPRAEDGDDISNVGDNFYQKGILPSELTAAFAAGFVPPYNGRVVQNRITRKIEASLFALSNSTLPDRIMTALVNIVAELNACIPLAKTEHMKNAIRALVKSFETGEEKYFREFNIEWVKDGTDSKLDFMSGFVEVYEDYKSKMGSWETYVNVVDPVLSQVSKGLAKEAQYFENLLPYGSFRKTFPKGYSPPAVMVEFLDEVSPMRVLGYNLPNYDDIRISTGAKNVISVNFPGGKPDAHTQEVLREGLSTYLPAERVDEVQKNWVIALKTLVLFHEIIGHGSGTYDATKFKAGEDPMSALGIYGNALEEERADLTALVLVADNKLVEMGYYKNDAEASEVKRSAYETYFVRAMLRLGKDKSFEEAHAKGIQIFMNKALEAGAIEFKVVGDLSHKNSTVKLVVRDVALYEKAAMDLLETLQRMKATRDLDGVKALFAKYGPSSQVNEPLFQAVIRNGAGLKWNIRNILQPWHMKPDGNVEIFGEPNLESAVQQWEKLKP